MHKEIVKSITKELVGSASESAFLALVSTVGFPTTALALPFAQGLVLGLVENCFNDCSQMTLSVKEKEKLNQVSSVALQTFWEMAEKDGVVAWEMNINPAYIDYAYEVAEHATLEAIRQSEKKKIDVLGRFYGRKFYMGNADWQDMHQMITMVGTLSFRQIVMIRLISEYFKVLNGKLFVGNPSACVEINRLKDYGIWQTEGAAFGINDSAPIQLYNIIPTDYCDFVSEDLMLDAISEEDVKMVIESLHLTTDGTPQKELTEEQFKQRTTFEVKGQKLILPGGKTYGVDPDEDMFLYDLARGK
jgi:hypothetical protein